MAEAPLRILYIDTAMSLAGGQVSLLEILKHLDRRRFTPVVACPAGSALAERCRRMGLGRLDLRFASSHISGGPDRPPMARLADAGASLAGAIGLALQIRRRRIDIVHANTFKAALVGGLASALARRPMIFHDRVHVSHGWVGRLVTRLSTRIIAVSRSVGSKHRGRSPGKVAVIHDGIDLDEFAPAPPRARGSIVGFLGRVSEEKGLMNLVESAGAVVRRVPGVVFAIGGAPFTPADEDHLKAVNRRIAELGLSRRFEFRGFVDDPRGFIESVDVLAVPSIHEALGLAMLQAMAIGRPVVAFDLEGPAEVLTDGADGILARPGDFEGFGSALARALSDEPARRSLVEKGRRTVTSGFSSGDFVRRVEGLYEDLVRR